MVEGGLGKGNGDKVYNKLSTFKDEIFEINNNNV